MHTIWRVTLRKDGDAGGGAADGGEAAPGMQRWVPGSRTNVEDRLLRVCCGRLGKSCPMRAGQRRSGRWCKGRVRKCLRLPLCPEAREAQTTNSAPCAEMGQSGHARAAASQKYT